MTLGWTQKLTDVYEKDIFFMFKYMVSNKKVMTFDLYFRAVN